MRLTKICFIVVLLVAAGVFDSANAAGYRDFVTPDAVQSDLLGPVRSIKAQTFEESENGGQKLVAEASSLYDPKGYLLEERNSDLEEGEVTLLKRTYDASGNLIGEEETEGTRVVKKKIRLAPERRRAYWDADSDDGRGGLLAEMTYDRFGKEGAGREYDEKGNISGQYRTRRDGKGKEIEVIFSDGLGRPEDVTRLTWDERGFDVASEHESKKEKVRVKTKNDYPEIDSQGNWLRQNSTSEFFEGSRRVLTTKKTVVREIAYY